MSAAARHIVVCAAVAGTLALAPAARAAAPVWLSVRGSAEVGGGTTLIISVQRAPGDPTRRVTIYVPHGYDGDLGALPLGRTMSHLSVAIRLPSGAVEERSGGAVRIEEPAKYAHDPAAQACSPGRHDSVWLLTAHAAGVDVAVPVFVDALARTPDAARGAFRLEMCLGPLAAGAELARADIATKVFWNPRVAGEYVWRAYFTPAIDGTFDPARAVEARSVVRLPLRLAITRARSSGERLVVSGVVTAGGVGWPRAVVRVFARARGRDVFVGSVSANAAGRFRLRSRLRGATAVYARTELDDTVFDPGCAGASEAGGGCVSATLAPSHPLTSRRTRVTT